MVASIPENTGPDSNWQVRGPDPSQALELEKQVQKQEL